MEMFINGRMVEWDKDIKFYPVSWVTHINLNEKLK